VAVSLVFALSFIGTRVVGYSLGLLDLWLSRELWLPANKGLYAVVAGTHAAFALNTFWATRVVGGIIRAVRGSREHED
jgi:hypothetical protein